MKGKIITEPYDAVEGKLRKLYLDFKSRNPQTADGIILGLEALLVLASNSAGVSDHSISPIHQYKLRENFPRRLNSLRVSRGLTLAELARGSNVGQNTLSRYENGHGEPDRVVLSRVMNYLGVPYSTFYEDSK
jgi:hypothetical protein